MSIYDNPDYDNTKGVPPAAAEAARKELQSRKVRHFSRILTVNLVEWNDVGSHVFGDKDSNLFLCVNGTKHIFNGSPVDGDMYFKNPCMDGLRVDDKRVFHVFKPILEQRPALGVHTTDLLDCHLVPYGKIVVGLTRDELSEHDMYPALDKFLRGTCGLRNGEQFYAWMSNPWSTRSDQTTEGDE